MIADIHEAERIGVDHLIFESPVQRDDERFDMIEAFAQDVLPAFRPPGASLPGGEAVRAPHVERSTGP